MSQVPVSHLSYKVRPRRATLAPNPRPFLTLSTSSPHKLKPCKRKKVLCHRLFPTVWKVSIFRKEQFSSITIYPGMEFCYKISISSTERHPYSSAGLMTDTKKGVLRRP